MTINPEILKNPKQWIVATWNQLGFAQSGMATRRGQRIMKNIINNKLTNESFNEINIQNINDGFDPNGIYKPREIKKLNVGSNGVGVWFLFEKTPNELKTIQLHCPVKAYNNMQQYVLHTGLDFNSNRNLLNRQHVEAAFEGVVSYISFDNRSGHYVVLLHKWNKISFNTLYMHLAQPVGIKSGTKLKKGEWFANVGNTGSASSCYSTHLHFEIRNFNNTLYYDPLSFYGINPLM